MFFLQFLEEALKMRFHGIAGDWKALALKQDMIYMEIMSYLDQGKSDTKRTIEKSAVTPELLEALICKGGCRAWYEDGDYVFEKACNK